MSLPSLTPILPTFPDLAALLDWTCSASAQAAALVVVVLALRALLGTRLSPGWRLALWLIVGLRLVTPVAVESRVSLSGVARSAVDALRPRPAAVATPATPTAPSGPTVTVTYGPLPGAPATPAVVAAPVAKRTLSPLVTIWLAGTAFLLARQLVIAARLRRDVRSMRRVDDAELLALAADCARTIGVRSPVRLVETDRLRCPAVCGILRPTVLLPVGVKSSLSREELRLVLLHEFAHVRRDDVLAGAIAGLIRALHWFNPLAWVAVRAFRADRELACDAAVLARLEGGDARRAYGACVLRVIEHMTAGRPHPASLGIFGSARSLRRRIDMIADRSHSLPWPRRAGRILVGTSAFVAIGCVAAAGEPAPTTAAPAASRPAAGGLNPDPLGHPLVRKIDELRLRDEPIESALATIAKKAGGLSLRVDWPALEPLGVGPGTRVTVSLRNVALDKTLAIVLAELKQPIDFETDGDAIVVSSADGIARQFTVSKTFAMPPLPADAEARATASRQVVQLIVDTVDPASWAGGERGGRIEVDGEQLKVTNTRRRVLRVAQLMDQLRADAPAKPAVTPEAAEKAKSDPVRAALDAPIGGETFKLDATPLTDALDFFRDTVKVPVFVNWTALEAAGIDRKTPVTLNLPGTVLRRKALSLMLEGAGGTVARLGWNVDDGVVTVSTQEDLAKNVLTRTYDVRDLLIVIPDFEAPTVTVGDARAATRPTTPAPPQPTREELVEQITATLMNAVAPDTWKQLGGMIGAIQALGGQLIVTQTPEVHAQIVDLLKALRAARGVQVNVEIRFLSVDPALVPTRLGDAQEKAAFLSDAEAAELLRKVQSSPDATTLTAPRLTLFNGQRAYVNVSSPTAYIANYTMTQTAAGERKFEPQIAEANTGVSIEVQATASADRRHATLTLGPRVTRLIALTSTPFAGDPSAKLTVQTPLLDTQELRTTASIPDRGTLLLAAGMMTDRDAERADGVPLLRPATRPATPEPPRQLLLLVKPTVIVQREVENEAFPLLDPK